jgi:hypothetical protein
MRRREEWGGRHDTPCGPDYGNILGSVPLRKQIEPDLTEHDAACLTGWPAIKWREPIRVRTMSGDGSSRLCCRLCIVRLGLRVGELESCLFAFRSKNAFLRHLKKTHGLEPETLPPRSRW